tara:strand:- start:467 stop:661 length:195 start_codon:yes stop_codon:yes gene_type:complete
MDKDYTETQLEHLYAKWLYKYGGSTDVKTLREYVDEYKGHPEILDHPHSDCPCYVCETSAIYYG